MSDTAKKQVRKLKIIEDDPNLSAFESDLNERVRHFKQRKKELLAPGQTLTEFASGHLYYGFHKVKGGWVYREWAPGATAMHLIGDFNNWNRTSHPMKAVGNGNWEIEIPGVRTLKHRGKLKIAVTSRAARKTAFRSTRPMLCRTKRRTISAPPSGIRGRNLSGRMKNLGRRKMCRR